MNVQLTKGWMRCLRQLARREGRGGSTHGSAFSASPASAQQAFAPHG